ncbi:MAG: host-nuclease inhibitor Gam family protein [Smithella sp.]|jgi:hypothetical protein
MKKQLDDVNSEKGKVKEDARILLVSIAHTQGIIEQQLDEYNVQIAKLSAPYEQTIEKLRADLATDEKALLSLMKKNKGTLFSFEDVVNLPNGSLIHNVGDHVTIPKTALADCQAQGFRDAIKVVESLDRDAIEKWPDAKLVLIGAQRKKKEEFKYSLKK